MRRLARFILPLLVFLAGLAAGAWISIGRRAADFSAGVDRRLAETIVAAPVPAASATRAFSTDEEMLSAIMSALVEEEPLLRAHRLHDLLGRLTSAELGLLFASTVKTEDVERRGELLGTLLARWVVVDPAAAAEAVRPYRDRCRVAGRWNWQSIDFAVGRAWAQAMPEAALAEAMAAPDLPWSAMSAGTAMETLAEGDAARQLEALARLPANRLRAEMCSRAIRTLAEKDTAAAEAALALLPEPQQRARLQSEILGKLTERDPAAGLARLATLAPDLAPGAASTRLAVAILRPAAAKDPSAALAALDALPEELRTSARASVLVGWAGEHPMEALEWAGANGVEVSEVKAPVFFGDSDGAGWNSLFGTALEHDREKALAWMRTQPASPQRDAMLNEGMWRGTTAQSLEVFAELTPYGRIWVAGFAVNRLYGEDRDRAVTWVKDLSPGAARAAAVQNLGYIEASFAPESLDALADAWPAGPDRDATLRGVALHVSQNDPARAPDYARRVSDPVMREAAFAEVARTWLYRDANSARVWLAGTNEISAESKRVILRQFDERQ